MAKQKQENYSDAVFDLLQEYVAQFELLDENVVIHYTINYI
jgi:hypothetical protein